jgi:hypothetical protein
MVLYWFSPRRTEFRMNRVGIFGKPPFEFPSSSIFDCFDKSVSHHWLNRCLPAAARVIAASSAMIATDSRSSAAHRSRSCANAAATASPHVGTRKSNLRARHMIFVARDNPHSRASRQHVWTAPPCKKFFDAAAKLVGCGRVSGLCLRSMTAGPDEVRGSGLNQSAAVIAACCMARCPNPRFDRLASRCLITPCKARLNVRIVRLLDFRIMPLRSRALPKLESFPPLSSRPTQCEWSCWQLPP